MLKTQKVSENGEIYTAGKNFTLPPAVTAWTNSTSAHKFLRKLFSNIAKGNLPFSKYELNCARTVSQRPCKLREIGRPLTFCKRLHLPTGWSLQQSSKDRVASNSQLNIKCKRRANPISEKYLLSRNIVKHGFTYPPPIHTGVCRCLQVRRVRSVANFCMWST